MTVDVVRGVGLRWSVEDIDPPDPNDGFILDIDKALKTKLHQRIYVNDNVSGASRRAVRFFFRWPQVEVTDQTFPFGTIDLLRFVRAADREQRSGDPYLPYTPKGYDAPDDDHFVHTEDMPIPYDFIYQVTLHARFNEHDREICYRMLQDDMLPSRGAYLVVGDTIRQMFVDGPIDASGVDPNPGGRPKRHFRKLWTVTVHGELFQKSIETLAKVATMVTDVASLE